MANYETELTIKEVADVFILIPYGYTEAFIWQQTIIDVGNGNAWNMQPSQICVIGEQCA